MKNHTLLGYVLLRPGAGRIHSIGENVSDVVPNYPLLTWGEDYSSAARDRFMAKQLIDPKRAAQLAEELAEMDEERLEFACRFYDLEDARKIKKAYFPGAEWKVVGYGVPNAQIEKLSEICKEAVQSGILASLQKELEFPAGAKTLGYDLLAVEQGEFSESFLDKIPQVNDFGLVTTEPEATLFAKPGGWFPVLVAEL